MNEDPQNLAEDLLRLLQGDRRARERFGELVRPLETIAAWYRKAALHLAQLVEQLESAPPIKGYEPVLLADGRDPLEARFFAAATLYVGKKSREEAHAERRLASAIAFLADVHGRGSLVISRRAKKLELALQEPSVEVPLSKAWSRARVLESPNQLDDLVARAIGRNAAACQRLTEIARALRPGLRDPRGRIPNLESATHEAFLALRDKLRDA